MSSLLKSNWKKLITSFYKTKKYKARINEYDQARQISPEAARETELEDVERPRCLGKNGRKYVSVTPIRVNYL